MVKRIEFDGAIHEFPDDFTDADISKALSSSSPAKPAPSVPWDMAKSLGAGVVEGTADMVGQPRDLASLAMNKGLDAALYLGNKARGFLGMAPVEPTPEQRGEFNRGIEMMTPWGGGQQNRERAEAITGPLPQSETTPGKYARTVGQFIPGALMAPQEAPLTIGGSLVNALKYGVVPGVTSEAAGQATEGTKFEPYARIAGAIAGSQVTDLAKRVITPNPISPDRQRMVDVLKKEGIDVTAGQKTDSTGLKYLESASGQVVGGGGKAAAIADSQKQQFTQAALKRAGIDAERATPEALRDAFNRLGNEFDTLASSTTIRPDQKLGMDLFDTMSDYFQKTSTAERKPYIESIAREIGQRAQAGSISGDFYKSTRSAIDRNIRSSSSPEFKEALVGLRDALDGAVERSISPDLVDRWKQVRREYRNILPIEDVAVKGSASDGTLSPQALRQSVVRMQGKRNYATGKGDFAELVRSADEVMKPLPDSGTAPRSQAFSILNGAGAIGGGTVGALLSGGNPASIGAGALAGQAAGLVAPAALSRALMSSPVQGYLGNQLVTAPSDPAKTRLLQAIMAAEAARREPKP